MTAGETWATLFAWPVILPSLAAAVGPGIPLAIMIALRKTLNTRTTAAMVGLAQVLALGANATSRQILQNIILGRSFDVLGQPTNVEWSPLLAFLVTFVFCVAVIVWMVAQVAKHAKSAPV